MNQTISQSEARKLTSAIRKTFGTHIPWQTFWRLSFDSAAQECQNEGLAAITAQNIETILGRKEGE